MGIVIYAPALAFNAGNVAKISCFLLSIPEQFSGSKQLDQNLPIDLSFRRARNWTLSVITQNNC